MLAYILQLMEGGGKIKENHLKKNRVLDIYLLRSNFVMMVFVVCYFAFLYYVVHPLKIYP